MNSRMTISVLLAGLLWGCDSTSTPQVVGTSSETATGVRLYLPSGAPAANARVQVFAVGDTGNLPVAQAFTDAKGVLAFDAPAKGRYNLVIRHPDGTSLLEDSLVSNGTSMPAWSDTLRAAGGVKGRVRVQPKDSPRIAWVHLLGSGIYANVDDSGRFAFGDVAPGRYTIEAVARDSTYTPTFRSARVLPDSTLDLGTIDLVYTGLPLVTGLAASYDTMAGTVTLHWNRSTDARVAAYLLLEGDASAPYITETAKTTSDTAVTIRYFPKLGFDSAGWDTTIKHRTYQVAPIDSSGRWGSTWEIYKLDIPSLFRQAPVMVSWAKFQDGYPALLKQWGSTLDTLAGSLLIYTGEFSQYYNPSWAQASIHASKDGKSWVRIDSSVPSCGKPVAWNNLLWRVEPHIKDTMLKVGHQWNGTSEQEALGIRYDSATVLARSLEGSWSKIATIPLPDSVNGGQLQILHDRLVFVPYYGAYLTAPGGWYQQKRGEFATSDGINWGTSASIDSSLVSMFSTSSKSPGYSIVSGNGANWTMHRLGTDGDHEPRRVWVAKGLSISQGSSTTLPDGCKDASLVSTAGYLFLGGNGCDAVADATKPNEWRVLNLSRRGGLASIVWNGKLVSVGDSGVYLGTIVPR